MALHRAATPSLLGGTPLRTQRDPLCPDMQREFDVRKVFNNNLILRCKGKDSFRKFQIFAQISLLFSFCDANLRTQKDEGDTSA